MRAYCSWMPDTRPRVLHAALVPRISQGIATQLLLEKQATRELGITWETALFSPRSDLEPFPEQLNMGPSSLEQVAGASMRRRVLTNLRLRRAFYSWLADVESGFDVILLRYSVHDRMQARFIRHSRAFIGLIHHAFEVEELRTIDGMVGKVRAGLEAGIGSRSIRHADLIVGVTQEIADHEVSRVDDPRKATLVYPNGGSDSATPVVDRRSETPHLLFAASYFSPWQGLDLLLSSLGPCDREFVLHLVGELSARDADVAAGDSRVIMHGSLTPVEMRDLAEVCWIGISSLAIERQGFLTACPLKVRDYLSMGLPAVGNHQEVLPKDFPFYVVRGPRISSILEVADEWRAVSRADVAEYSHPYISKKLIVRSFYDDLSRVWIDGVERGRDA